jgi:hypothetical protein
VSRGFGWNFKPQWAVSLDYQKHQSSVMDFETVGLVNVGANLGHGSKARSPVFDDGTFTFVSVPMTNPGARYTGEARAYVRNAEQQSPPVPRRDRGIQTSEMRRRFGDSLKRC